MKTWMWVVVGLIVLSLIGYFIYVQNKSAKEKALNDQIQAASLAIAIQNQNKPRVSNIFDVISGITGILGDAKSNHVV